jgi:hypothetical protein
VASRLRLGFWQTYPPAKRPVAAQVKFSRTKFLEENPMQETHAMVISGEATRSDPVPYSCVAARYRVIAYLAAVSPLLLMLLLAALYHDPHRTEIVDRKPVISVTDKR